jgi:hypothetical protein
LEEIWTDPHSLWINKVKVQPRRNLRGRPPQMSLTPPLLKTTAARLSCSLASTPKFHRLTSAFVPRPLLGLRPISKAVSPLTARVLSTFNVAMGDAPDAGMDAVQRRLMFEDEYVFPFCPFLFFLIYVSVSFLLIYLFGRWERGQRERKPFFFYSMLFWIRKRMKNFW